MSNRHVNWIDDEIEEIACTVSSDTKGQSLFVRRNKKQITW